MSTTVWEADAPGTWSLDLTHVPPGSTTLVQAIMRTSSASKAPLYWQARMSAASGDPANSAQAFGSHIPLRRNALAQWM